MADHIWIGEVQDDKVVILQASHHFKRQIRRAHLRLFVIRRHLLRADREIVIFASKRDFDTSVKEKGDVRIFLCLCSAKLLQARSGNHFAENVRHRLRPENHAAALGGVSRVVFRQRVVADFRRHFAVEAVEVFVEKRDGKLARAVGPEVEPQDHIAIAHTLFVRVTENHWQEKFIAARFLDIGGLNGIGWRNLFLRAFAEHNRVPRELVSLPALVAIHRVVATDDRGDLRAARFEFGFELFQITHAACGRSVASVGDRVNH